MQLHIPLEWNVHFDSNRFDTNYKQFTERKWFFLSNHKMVSINVITEQQLLIDDLTQPQQSITVQTIHEFYKN